MSNYNKKTKKGSGTNKKYSDPKNYKGKSNSKNARDPRDNKDTKHSDSERYSNRDGEYVNSGTGNENDPAWYNRNARLIQDVTQIPFGNQLGKPIDTRPGVWSNTIPGICVMRDIITPGVATSGIDGPNLAATGVYQFIRKSLSTTASYAPADVFMYIMGIDEIYSLYSHILRAFGLANAYSSVNLFLPKAVVRAGYGMTEDGWNDFISNMNNYRGRFNNLIYKASALYLPTDFTITKRHTWLFSNIFMDTASVKGQIYMHIPEMMHTLNETKYDTGTALSAVAMSGIGDEEGVKISDYLNLFDTMITKYFNSDSMMKIAADMRRAFADRQFWKLAYADEAYMVLPVFSQEALDQIHNLSILPNSNHYEVGDFDISQNVDTNTVQFQPKWRIAAIPCTDIYCADVLLDFSKDVVSSDDVLTSTRMAASCRRSGDYLVLSQCGADICVGCDIYYFQWSATDGEALDVLMLEACMSNAPSIGYTNGELQRTLHYAIMFDYAPKFFINLSGNAAVAPSYSMISRIDNYTLVSQELLTRIHSNVMLSMWSIPQLGSFEA